MTGLLPLVTTLALAALAAAQDHAMHGMTMPMPAAPRAAPVKKPAPRPARRPRPRPAPAAAAPEMPTMDHAAMGHGPPAVVDEHAGHDMTAMAMDAAPPAGTDLPPGNAPAPAPPAPHYADRYWDPAAMARARTVMMREEGGAQTFAQVMVNIAEYQARRGGDGYRWDGEGWFGGDINRLVVKSEGEGDIRGGVDAAEMQALYSRAVGPYFNLQAGFRRDIRPTPMRTYATIGVEGLAPYWFEVEAAAFLSTRGEVLGRVEGYYDQRLTQRLILQPRIELNLSAQDIAATGTGSGIVDAELGLRLRYEIRREFAPYVGVSWERRLGDTARFARRAGEDIGGASVVIGVRGWF